MVKKNDQYGIWSKKMAITGKTHSDQNFLVIRVCRGLYNPLTKYQQDIPAGWVFNSNFGWKNSILDSGVCFNGSKLRRGGFPIPCFPMGFLWFPLKVPYKGSLKPLQQWRKQASLVIPVRLLSNVSFENHPAVLSNMNDMDFSLLLRYGELKCKLEKNTRVFLVANWEMGYIISNKELLQWHKFLDLFFS